MTEEEKEIVTPNPDEAGTDDPMPPAVDPEMPPADDPSWQQPKEGDGEETIIEPTEPEEDDGA